MSPCGLTENDYEKLNTRIRDLKQYKKALKSKCDRKFIIMMFINLLIVLLSASIPLGLIPNLGQDLSTIIAFSSMAGLTGVNTIIGYKNLKKNDKIFNDVTEQINYLESVSKKIENEVKNTKEKNIDINDISRKFDWRKQLKLMKVYATYKHAFIKHYKKDDLYEVLQANGYNNAETYYLYEKTKEEIEKKQKEKVLRKENLKEIWK